MINGLGAWCKYVWYMDFYYPIFGMLKVMKSKENQ